MLIDSRLTDGAMSIGECVIQGETEREILISAHACHPALANDNASALAVATFAAEALAQTDGLRHTIRFLFAPGTVGALAWLAANPDAPRRVGAGLVLANLGDSGGFVYKRSRRGTLGPPEAIDRAVAAVLPGAEDAPVRSLRVRRAPVQQPRHRPCPSGASPERRTASTPSTTPPPTIWD